jgi:hypothetical protein
MTPPLSLNYDTSTYFVQSVKSSTRASDYASTINLPENLAVATVAELTRVGPVGEGNLANEIVYEAKGLPSGHGISDDARTIQHWLLESHSAQGNWQLMQPKLRMKRRTEF